MCPLLSFSRNRFKDSTHSNNINKYYFDKSGYNYAQFVRMIDFTVRRRRSNGFQIRNSGQENSIRNVRACSGGDLKGRSIRVEEFQEQNVPVPQPGNDRAVFVHARTGDAFNTRIEAGISLRFCSNSLTAGFLAAFGNTYGSDRFTTDVNIYNKRYRSTIL